MFWLNFVLPSEKKWKHKMVVHGLWTLYLTHVFLLENQLAWHKVSIEFMSCNPRIFTEKHLFLNLTLDAHWNILSYLLIILNWHGEWATTAVGFQLFSISSLEKVNSISIVLVFLPFSFTKLLQIFPNFLFYSQFSFYF